MTFLRVMLFQENGEKGVVLYFTINHLYFYLIYERRLLTICEGKINKYLCETEDNKFAKRNYHLKRARQRFTYKNMISRIVMFDYLTYTIYSIEKVSNLSSQWKYPCSGSLSPKNVFYEKVCQFTERKIFEPRLKHEMVRRVSESAGRVVVWGVEAVGRA